MIRPGHPLRLRIPIRQGHMDREDQKVLQKHSSRWSCGSNRAKSSCALSTGQRFTWAAPTQRPRRAAHPPEKEHFQGPALPASETEAAAARRTSRSQLGNCRRTHAGQEGRHLRSLITSKNCTEGGVFWFYITYFSPFTPGTRASPAAIWLFTHSPGSLPQPALQKAGLQLRMRLVFS